MDFVRFSGELFIYYVLIAIVGGVLTAFVAAIFRAVGVDFALEAWLLSSGAAGAVFVAAWLVEVKQSVVETWRRCSRASSLRSSLHCCSFFSPMCCGAGLE